MRVRGGFVILLLFTIFLQIAFNVLLWMTAAKDPATIPSRVSVYYGSNIQLINIGLYV